MSRCNVTLKLKYLETPKESKATNELLSHMKLKIYLLIFTITNILNI